MEQQKSSEVCEVFSAVKYHEAKPFGPDEDPWPPNPGSNAGNSKSLVLQVVRGEADSLAAGFSWTPAEASSTGIVYEV